MCWGEGIRHGAVQDLLRLVAHLEVGVVYIGRGYQAWGGAPCSVIHTLMDIHFRLKVMLGTSGLAERIQEREAAIREANGRVNVLEDEQER